MSSWCLGFYLFYIMRQLYVVVLLHLINATNVNVMLHLGLALLCIQYFNLCVRSEYNQVMSSTQVAMVIFMSRSHTVASTYPMKALISLCSTLLSLRHSPLSPFWLTAVTLFFTGSVILPSRFLQWLLQLCYCHIKSKTHHTHIHISPETPSWRRDQATLSSVKL